MKVSFFVSDLASNAIVRAGPLASALRAAGYEIEVIGLLTSGPSVYSPYRERFDYKTLLPTGPLRKQIRALARMATGDIIYACKPTVTTFLPALLASGFGLTKPLFLDAEDDELWIAKELLGGDGWLPSVRKFWRLRWNYMLHPLTRLACGATVVSRRLQRRYGGTIVLHGPDESEFDPGTAGHEQSFCRERFGLPVSAPLVLFAGLPRPHKGLDILVSALEDKRLCEVHLVLAGPPDADWNSAGSRLGPRVHHLGMLANSAMPALLAACDIVPSPQHECEFTEAQIPAKLLEGLAMGKTVIASRVSDLPLILGDNDADPRGWLHAPGDVKGLADCIHAVISNPDEAARRARKGRGWFLEHASAGALRTRMAAVVENAARVN